MHTMWKGSISFGLVNVPIRMYAATSSSDVKFRYLHNKCHTPVQMKRTCPKCDVEVPWADLVRGFEVEPDRFVVIEEDEWEQFETDRTKTIEITDFVKLTDIDPIYFQKSYYLAPDETGKKAYALLRAAMDQTGKIAVAKMVLRNSETLACLRTGPDGTLMVETLFWPEEVRNPEELPNIHEKLKTSEQELEMACQLINQLERTFDPTQYTNERRQNILEFIEAKAEEKKISVVEPSEKAQNRDVLDLAEALQASLKMTKPAVSKKRKRKTGTD